MLGRDGELSLGLCSFPVGTWSTVHTGVPSSTKKQKLSNSFYTVVYFTTHIHICLYIHTHTSLQQACATSTLEQLGFSLTVLCHPSLQGTLLLALSWGPPWPGSPSVRCEGGQCVCWGPFPPPG